MLGKFPPNRYSLYYAQTNLKDTSFERKLQRFKQDPIRLYDGSNEDALNKLGKLGGRLI
jgi:hypothetical protein